MLCAHLVTTHQNHSNSNSLTMNKKNLIIVIVSAIGALASFLPWMGTDEGSENLLYFKGGWIAIILYAIPLVYCLFALIRGKALKSLGAKLLVSIPALIVSVISILIFVIYAVFVSDVGVSFQYGFYLSTISGLVVAIVAFVMKAEDKSGGTPA